MVQNLRYSRQRIEALADKQCKFGGTCRVTLEHIIVQSVNKISYDSLSNWKRYWKERISYQRTIIDIFLKQEGNVWIL